MAEVSIIVPVYNVEKYIRKCVETIINQTLKDIEIIIVNDGTKDKSIQVIKDIINQDERIVLINKENGGLMSAWMTGVRAASSDYIGFVDSDDWIDLNYFEYLLKKAKNADADIVVGKYLSEYENKSTELYRSSEKMYEGATEIRQLFDSYFQGIFLEDNIISYCRWDKIYKRSIILDNFKYLNTKISLGEDINTNCAVIPDCKRILVLKESPYYHYRQNAASIANTFKPKQIENIECLFEALINIAEEKNLNTEKINIFIGDMIFTQIRLLYDSKLDWSEKKSLLNNLVGKNFVKKPLQKYSMIQGKFKKLFIKLFIGRQFKICKTINTLYRMTKGK